MNQRTFLSILLKVSVLLIGMIVIAFSSNLASIFLHDLDKEMTTLIHHKIIVSLYGLFSISGMLYLWWLANRVLKSSRVFSFRALGGILIGLGFIITANAMFGKIIKTTYLALEQQQSFVLSDFWFSGGYLIAGIFIFIHAGKYRSSPQ